MQRAGAREGLDRRDLATRYVAHSTLTGVIRCSVNQHRARTARPLTAARLGPGKTQFAPQYRQQRRRGGQGPGNAVDLHSDFSNSTFQTIVTVHDRMLTARASGIFHWPSRRRP